MKSIELELQALEWIYINDMEIIKHQPPTFSILIKPFDVKNLHPNNIVSVKLIFELQDYNSPPKVEVVPVSHHFSREYFAKILSFSK